MTDVMLDIEAFGSSKFSSICQIGACYFDRVTGEIGSKFLVNIDARIIQKEGAHIDADTVYWWLSQSKEAQDSILKAPRIHPKIALEQLDDFLVNSSAIWSHATYDFVCVSNAYNIMNLTPVNWRHKKARDIRTIVDLGKVSVSKETREGTHHNALDDAIFQVKYLVKSLNNISKRATRKPSML